MDIVFQKIYPFAENLYQYLNFDQIAGFVDEGRGIPLEEIPKVEYILGISK